MPSLVWLPAYRWSALPDDAIAGLIVAILLVPQSMAYALLAGLPPQVGLYASIVPVALYALLGTSSSLAVGPVAIVSLLVAGGLAPLATAGSPDYLRYALTLALLVGLVQSAMGWLRLGFVVNFLSHAVLTGFTSAAALVIAASQLEHLLGIPIGGGQLPVLLQEVVRRTDEARPATMAIGASALLLLAVYPRLSRTLLERTGASERWSGPLSKVGPFLVVFLGALVAWRLELDQASGVAVVGAIPAGLPGWTAPSADPAVWRSLAPTAVAISFIGFLESFAVAKVLSARRREKVRADQELIALGAANLGAAFTGGYPVTGGFSRSMVSFTAGARSGLTGLIAALAVALSLLWLTPLFAYLPKACLAAIILAAVSQLIELGAPRRLWRYSRADAAAFVVTFVTVLAAGVERGVLVGALAALGLHVWRTTRPHLAIVGRVEGSEHFRNVRRHAVETWPELLLVRMDESLYFANARVLEELVLQEVADRPEVEHVVLIASAINFIDGSALESLATLRDELATAGITLHLAEVKGPVMDRLEKTPFLDELGSGRVFLSTASAVAALARSAGARQSPVKGCAT